MTARARLSLLAVIAAVAAAGAVPPARAAEPPPPPGANDWSCQPTAAHPRPVVLVHGTFANRSNNWRAIAPDLASRGYCVYALNYGANRWSADTWYGLGPVAKSAQELSAFVNRVLAATGAAEVDVVGHSQGGMLPRHYTKFLGGAAKVHTLVGIAPSSHGTTAFGLAALAQQFPGASGLLLDGRCDSCRDQLAGSDFMTALNAGGDTQAGVTYTVIATRYDEVVTPYQSQFLNGPGVTNVLVQDQCAADPSEHVSMAYDPVVQANVRNALDPANATPVGCLPSG
ncbi:MAG TPA: alpha/beta fold hydrolase [Solirubrobacteraceae bacterium]|jgi:triacylglycerol esterase/lipase EstA (alpha/beta hydrolase family)|nr:alpha/beta fold hydrolase [Solirubrobacteraceae bacterium]